MAVKLTRQEIEELWVRAGGNPQNASTASAIALAESGGDPSAVNGNSNGSTDRGLWQVNSVHGSLSTFDPLANARAAVSISSNGANWKPWCVAWSDGACGGTFMGPGSPVLKFLGLGGDLSDQVVGGSPSQFQNQALGGVSWNPKDWADAVLQPLGVWAYAGMLFVLGLGLMGVGFWLLFRETQIGASIESKAVGAVKSAATGGLA